MLLHIHPNNVDRHDNLLILDTSRPACHGFLTYHSQSYALATVGTVQQYVSLKHSWLWLDTKLYFLFLCVWITWPSLSAMLFIAILVKYKYEWYYILLKHVPNISMMCDATYSVCVCVCENWCTYVNISMCDVSGWDASQMIWYISHLP